MDAMDYEQLKELYNKVEKVVEAEKDLKKLYKEKETCCKNATVQLERFDSEHKEAFIRTAVGKNAPSKPSKWLFIVPPVYIGARIVYNSKNNKYNNERVIAEKDYLDKYLIERADLAKKDKHDLENVVRMMDEKISYQKNQIAEFEQELDNDKLLGDELKNIQTLEALLSYFENKRADSLKEAVNLWFDEKRKDEEAEKQEAFRQEMLELQERAAEAAEEAARYAEAQCEAAEEAARYARETAERVNDLENAYYNIE